MAKNCTFSLKEEKYFKCGHCVYRTVRKHNLKRHIDKMHTASSKALECCGRLFFTKSNLRDHLKTFHRNGFRCSICTRGFQRKALLTRHMAVHNDKKEFRCSLCTYETSHKSNLERHKKVHRQKVSSVACNKRDSYKRCMINNAIRPRHSIKDVQILMGAAENAGEFRCFNREYKKRQHIFNHDQGKEILVKTMDRKDGLLPFQNMHKAITSTSFLTRYHRAFEYSMENTDKTWENLQRMAQASWLYHIYCTTQSSNHPYQRCSVKSSGTRELKDPNDILEIENRSEEQRKDDHVHTHDLERDRDDYNRAKLKQLRLCYLPYKCNFCNSRFTSQQNLNLHSSACSC